jgi:type VI secretion system secreted protein VgrG
VLKDCGITDLSDKTKSCGKVERDYCVQYAESSFNFVSRLMEDEGIFFYFEHSDSKHTLVLADSASAHEKIPGEAKIEFMKAVGSVFPLGTIFNTSMTTAVNTGGYATADYNYTISQTKLLSKLDSQWKGQNFYEYPGNFAKLNEGDDFSKLRVQLFEFKHCLFAASSTVPNLVPGFSFELSGHHYAKFNKEYVVYSVEHFFSATSGSGYIYTNSFRAFPKGTEFRSERKTPRPRICGNQTAVVVCPSGEEIFRNEHCCVKVHFHWDQIGKDKDAEDSSCWIRVAQLISGNSWGAVFVPRVGQEVVVSFLEGDPDRPLIVGCVYNDQFMPPYTDKEAMKSCIKTATFKDDDHKMFNEFRFNDEKDKQEIYVHAEKDMYINIKNSRKTEIEEADDTLDIFKGNRTITLQAKGDAKANHSMKLTKGDCLVELTEGDHKFLITKGKEDITLKEGNRSITLSKGDLSYDVTGNFSLKVSGDITIKADGNISIEAGKVFKIKSGQDTKIESGTVMDVKSGTDMKIKSGMNMETEAGMNMKLKGGMNLEAEASLMMKLKGGVNCEIQAGVQTKVGGTMVEVSGTGMTKVSAPMITVGGGMLQLG